MGGGVLLVENNSISNLLEQVYSEYKWEKDLFEQQQNIWTDINLANYFVEWLVNSQNENEVSFVCQYVKQIKPKGFNSLTQSLQDNFSKYWMKIGPSNSKKSQYILKACIEHLFSRENIIIFEDYWHPDVLNLELDYYLPEHRLAFEYQVCSR